LKKEKLSLIIETGFSQMKKSIVLFSGGIDSTTALLWALRSYDDVSALTFDYEQRNKIEIQAAKETAKKQNVIHEILKVDLSLVGGSALTDPGIALPEFHRIEASPPQTYVPFRNGIFISLAAAWGEARGIHDIVCGFNAIDSPNYPDTRAPFVAAMEDALNLGTKSAFSEEKFKLYAPFINMKKSEIIREGLRLGADYSYSISCYAEHETPCQKCSSCLLRKKAWDEIGNEDHLLVRLRKEGKI
jgi:7-cyano-7-deazaguanine synthase